MRNEQYRCIQGSKGILRGIVHKTNASAKAIVVLVHGYFTSNKLGPANLYVQIARLFASNGYEFWRFDSYGIGDSDGEFNETSYQLRLKDYSIIINEAIKHTKKTIILGHSMGCNLAIRLAQNISNIPIDLFLLSPAFGTNIKYNNLFSQNQLNHLFQTGFVYRKSQLIKLDFIHQMANESIHALISQSMSTIFIFYGLKDEFYDINTIVNLSNSENANFKLITVDSDHNFLFNREILLRELNKQIRTYCVH